MDSNEILFIKIEIINNNNPTNINTLPITFILYIFSPFIF